jgi:radical SAM superfamily enzyme YgiQ (UPF0313 family)
MKQTIALISPKRSLWSKNAKIKGIFEMIGSVIRPWYSPPLSLLTIAAVTPENYEIEFIDEDFEEIDFTNKFDIVGISAMTQQALRAYEIADKFRAIGIHVVMGGIHATVLPEEALKHVDTVVIGEGEELWNTFLEDFTRGSPQRIYENINKYSYCLENSPIPRYDLLKNDHIHKNKNFFNMIPVQATRGCPHDCCFCLVSKIYGKKIRKKSITHIVKELQTIQLKFGNQLIMFADDNLFVDKEYAKSLMKAMVPLRLNWVGQSDVSISNDDELMKLAYASGCLMLLIGFESLNEESLSTINAHHWKMNRVNQYSDVVKRIQENGINVHAAFVVGFDEDDESIFTKIRDFSFKNQCAGQYTILTPIPGSKRYDELKSEGRLFRNEFWDECNFFDVVFQPKEMNKEQLEDGLIWLYKEIFSPTESLKRAEHMKGIYKKLPLRWQ